MQRHNQAPPPPEVIEEPDRYIGSLLLSRRRTICDFTFANAMDTTTTLYDYGDIVVIKYMTEWCPYCRDTAEAERFKRHVGCNA